MTVAQAASGGLGAVLAGILVASLNKYAGYTIDQGSAAAIVGTGIGLVGWIGHGVDVYGLRGVVGRIWRGSSASK